MLYKINKLKHIATICVLHHDEETDGGVLKESLFVANYVGMTDFESSHKVIANLYDYKFGSDSLSLW